MDWVDELSEITSTPLPSSPPGYWNHGLVKHLDLPDEWPVAWESETVQVKGFALFLESFDPPYNFQGLAHQLIPLEFIIKELSKKVSFLGTFETTFEIFLEKITDYISTSQKEERDTLTASKLVDISELGIWRFHFHCSQVVRDKIDTALNVNFYSDTPDQRTKLISLSKLEYLRDGSLDVFYKAISIEMHCYLKRRQLLKVNQHKKNIFNKEIDADNSVGYNKAQAIYNEALSCEHVLHFSHLLVLDYKNKDIEALSKNLKDTFRWLADKKTRQLTMNELYPANTRAHINKVIVSIQSVHTLLSTFGGYRGRRSGKKKAFLPNIHRAGRLMPIGRYEEIKEESEVIEEIQIDNPLDIINGISDDSFSDALLRRKYGRRPKMLEDLGESEEDYQETNSINIQASWLSDPYGNAIKQRVQMESLILDAEQPAWSPACLMATTIKQYIQSTSKSDADVHLLSMLSFYTGLCENDLKNIRIGSPPIFDLLQKPEEISLEDFMAIRQDAELNWTDIFINPETKCYSYLLKKDHSAYFNEYNPKFIEGCESSSCIVHIPLPNKIIQPFMRWYAELRDKYDGVFCKNVNDSSSYIKLFRSWKKISGKWADLMKITGRRCSENITPKRIRSTFRALFVGQMGLSPLHANMIMRDIPLNQKSQHFYGNISYEHLKSQYHFAATYITQELSEESAITAGDKSARDNARFGSRLVPKRECLQTYFSDLYSFFITDLEKTVISPMTWNALTLYVFRLLQLSTGIRPSRDSLPDWSDISFKLNWIRISDKDNLHYYESRIIPMSTKLKQWLNYLALLQPTYFIGINYHRQDLLRPFRDKVTNTIFTFMDEEKKQIRQLSFDDLAEIEGTANISQPFNFKTNALRHHLFTRLHESNIDLHIIDFIMGHKHFGHEPFGSYSPISTNQYATLAIQSLDEYVVEPVHIPSPPLPYD